MNLMSCYFASKYHEISKIRLKESLIFEMVDNFSEIRSQEAIELQNN
jgi:hypothetical protein